MKGIYFQRLKNAFIKTKQFTLHIYYLCKRVVEFVIFVRSNIFSIAQPKSLYIIQKLPVPLCFLDCHQLCMVRSMWKCMSTTSLSWMPLICQYHLTNKPPRSRKIRVSTQVQHDNSSLKDNSNSLEGICGTHSFLSCHPLLQLFLHLMNLCTHLTIANTRKISSWVLFKAQTEKHKTWKVRNRARKKTGGGQQLLLWKWLKYPEKIQRDKHCQTLLLFYFTRRNSRSQFRIPQRN